MTRATRPPAGASSAAAPAGGTQHPPLDSAGPTSLRLSPAAGAAGPAGAPPAPLRPASPPASPPASAPDSAPAPQPAPPKPTSAGAAAAQAWSALRPITIGLVALVVLVGGFGTWAATTQISGAIIAMGQIEVERNRQVIQHPDGGVVEAILVDEGDSVAEGDILIRLDPTNIASSLATAESQLFELQARRGRLEAERDGVARITFPDEIAARARVEARAAELMDGQSRLFEARATTVASSVEQLRGRRNQISRQIEGIEAQESALEKQLGFIEKELVDQQSLLDRGLAQASRVSSLQREQARLQGSVGELLANAGEAAERISEIELQILQLDSTRREEAITQLRDLQVRELELAETRNTLREQLGRMDIRASVSGIVYGLEVFARRAVIRPAEPLLYIVPQDRPLVIAARVEPVNIDQIAVGQEVTVRFSAFDARTTPELTGEVLQISADAFVDEASRVSFYRAEVRLSEEELARLPDDLALIPGMPVETFIRTDDRTPIGYLVKPLADYFTRAFREG